MIRKLMAPKSTVSPRGQNGGCERRKFSDYPSRVALLLALLAVAGCDSTEQACAEGSSDQVCTDRDAVVDISPVESGSDAGLDAGCENCSANQCRDSRDCLRLADAPYCSGTLECVQCLEAKHCPGSEPRCESGFCTGCTANSDCSGHPATPTCDRGTCVECTWEEAAKCASETKVCLDGGTTCVECNVDTDCKQPGEAKCDLTKHECVPCDRDDQCMQHAELNHDKLEFCRAGTCVECAPRTETIDCERGARRSATSCDPDRFVCTNTRLKSVGTCGTCKSDSECVNNHECVRVPFGAHDSGYHCMRRESAGCFGPYQALPIIEVSKNGESVAKYCAHDTKSTACEELAALCDEKDDGFSEPPECGGRVNPPIK